MLRATTIIVTMLATLAAGAPATATESVCWNDGSGALVTCAQVGWWDPDRDAFGRGVCSRAIVLYDLGSGQQSTGWQTAGAAVELGGQGQVLHVC